MSLRIVSLFSGCGGADAGLYDAADELGIEVEVVAAYDSWPKAVAVYNANLRHPVAQVCDLKTLQRADLPPHDLVIGGPPCQPFSMAGKRTGHSDERNCLPDFVRLVGDKPYLMENVAPRLIPTSFSVKLCAADFGDVTSRKRWFYSNYLLNVIPTPGPRRIRDIRDHAEDERVLKKRRIGQKNPATDDDFMGTVTSSPHGGVSGFNQIETPWSHLPPDVDELRLAEIDSRCKAGAHGHYDSLDSLQAHSWHGHDVRGSGKLVAIEARCRHCGHSDEDHEYRACRECSCAGFMTAAMDREYRGVRVATKNYGYTPRDDGEVMPSVRASSHHGPPYTLRLGLRGNSASASASAFEDDAVLGSVLSNSFHANEASRIVACRNPSLLEMQRAHSFPDTWDWAGATKTDRGKMIANSWPQGMAKAVCKAMLVVIGATVSAA